MTQQNNVTWKVAAHFWWNVAWRYFLFLCGIGFVIGALFEVTSPSIKNLPVAGSIALVVCVQLLFWVVLPIYLFKTTLTHFKARYVEDPTLGSEKKITQNQSSAIPGSSNEKARAVKKRTFFAEFFAESATVAAALVLSVVALSFIAWAVSAVYKNRQEVEFAVLAKPKQFPEKEGRALQIKYQLSTLWRDGKMQYRFRIIGYPDAVEKAREEKERAIFTLTLLDADGFNVFAHEISLGAMTRQVDSNGGGTGLHIQGDLVVNAETYRRAEKFQVAWRGFRAAKLTSD